MTPTPEELRKLSAAGRKKEAARKRKEQQTLEAIYQKGKAVFFETHRDAWITAIKELTVAKANYGQYHCVFSRTVDSDHKDHQFYGPLMRDLETYFSRQGFDAYIDTNHWTESGSDRAGYPDTDTWTLTLNWHEELSPDAL